MSTGWTPYKEWYPYFESHILGQFADICQDEMNTPHTVDAWCQRGAVCIYDNINSYTQSQLGGAAVLLGLTPATLAILSPSDMSLAFLSTERPLLSVMLAASTATLSVGYPFARVSPLQPLTDALGTIWSVDSLMGRLMEKAALVSSLQYFLAAAATANTVHMSYDITRKTIVSWSCPNWAWVLCWSFVPLFLHLVNAVILRFTVDRKPQHSSTVLENGEPTPKRGALSRVWNWLLDVELRPCSGRVLPQYTIKFSLPNQILWWLPRIGSYLQYLMGVSIFSSLLFVPISDAFPIIVRYAVSAVVARCILGLELQSLKRRNRLSDAEGAVSSPRFDATTAVTPRRTMTVKEEIHLEEVQLSGRR